VAGSFLALALLAGICEWEKERVRALLPQNLTVKDQGLSLQRHAFERPDVLTLYGTSELIRRIRGRASVFFRHAPTGFTVDPIGRPGAVSLVTAEKIAAYGPEARGRKVAICLSPSSFYVTTERSQAYAANFSPLQAREALANPRLSRKLRCELAERMLEYPETLRTQPLLRHSIRRQLAHRLGDRLREAAFGPLCKAENGLLQVQDHLQVAQYLWENRNSLGRPGTKEKPLDWDEDLQAYERRTPTFHIPTGKHAVGASTTAWWKKGGFRNILETSPEWDDFDLLLRVSRESGVDVLVLCIPMNGIYMDQVGAPAESREPFYSRLEQICRKRKVALVDFREHEYDPKFFLDTHDHLSPKGWLHIDRTLDEFFHNQPLSAANAPAHSLP
jgi:D-alanine transfer protein